MGFYNTVPDRKYCANSTLRGLREPEHVGEQQIDTGAHIRDENPFLQIVADENRVTNRTLGASAGICSHQSSTSLNRTGH